MKYSVSAIIFGFLAAISSAAPTPDDKPSPGEVTIQRIGYAGSGCKAGTVSISYSQELQTLDILLDEFEPTIGHDTTIPSHVMNCNLNFLVDYPPGYQYTLYKYDHTGYVLLEPGTTLKQTSTYWFPGPASKKATFQSSLNGPYDGIYTFSDTFESTLWVWSPCGISTTLNMDTHLARTSNIGSIDTKVIINNPHAYGVNWRRCS